MKKILIGIVVFAFVFVALTANKASATLSRVESMGNQEIYLVDDENIFRNPANITAYGNTVFLNLNGEDALDSDQDAWGGGIINLYDNLYIGLFVARAPGYGEDNLIAAAVTNAIAAGMFTSGVLPNGPATIIPVPPPIIDLEAVDWMNPFDIIVGGKFGDISVGLKFYLANGGGSDEWTADGLCTGFPQPCGPFGSTTVIDGFEDEVTQDLSATLFSIDLGVSADMGDLTPELWLDISPFSVSTEYKLDYGDATSDISLDQEVSGTRFAIGGRLLYKMSDSITLIPQFQYVRATADFEVDQDTNNPAVDDLINNDDYEITWQRLRTGLGIQYSADRVLVVGSLGLFWEKETIEWDNSEAAPGDVSGEITHSFFHIPTAALALEYDINDLITIRTGIDTTVGFASHGETNDVDNNAFVDLDTEQTTTRRIQVTNAAAGLGFHLGNLDIDATVGGELLADEGTGTGGAFFSRANFRYRF